MEKLNIREKNENESLFKIISLIIGLVFVFFGFKDKRLLQIILGVLFLFYSTYCRDTYLSKEGLVNTYKGFMFKRDECINFREIDEIVILKQRNVTIMFLIKEPMAKKVNINSEKLNELIRFIKDNTTVSVTIES